jgi:hypothetical protein
MVIAPPWLGQPLKLKPVVQIEPSEEEKRNGWTTKTLSAYLAEREAAQGAVLDPAARRPARPQQAKGHRWNFPARRSRQIKTPSWQR